MTSPAGCLPVSPDSPCSSNLFLPQSLLICGPILPGLKRQTSSRGCPLVSAHVGLTRRLVTESQSAVSPALLLSVVLFGWLLIGLPAQLSPPHFCCLLRFFSLLNQFGICFATYKVVFITCMPVTKWTVVGSPPISRAPLAFPGPAPLRRCCHHNRLLRFMFAKYLLPKHTLRSFSCFCSLQKCLPHLGFRCNLLYSPGWFLRLIPVVFVSLNYL